MADAVALAKLGDPAAVNWALGRAAVTARFAEGDLAAILTHRAGAGAGPTCAAAEAGSLAQGTASWAGFGVAGTRR